MTRERRCLRSYELPPVFPVLHHPSLQGCKLGNESRRGDTIRYLLVCKSPQVATGIARLNIGPGRIVGVLEITLERTKHLAHQCCQRRLTNAEADKRSLVLANLNHRGVTMVYGSTYQRYGAGRCPRCNVAHANFLHTTETQRSRFKIMQFNAELMAQSALPPMINVGAGQKFMVGLLISGQAVLVAASGNNNNRIQRIAQLKHYTLCPAVNGFAGHRSRVGRVIPTAEYQATQAAGAGAPGQCAAPRLIQHAFTIPAVAANWRNWELSEVFYQPNTERRTRDDLHWIHGLSAHHCGTCESLVPLLMCTRP